MTAEPDTPWVAPGRSRVCPFIVCRDADRVVDFAQAVFDAELLGAPLRRETGELWNAELRIGDTTIMVGEAQGDMHRPAFLYVYVADLDATFARAKDAGARVLMEPASQFYGATDGGVADPADNWWWIARHDKTLTDAEVEAGARAQEASRKDPA
jgi:PhnB protein